MNKHTLFLFCTFFILNFIAFSQENKPESEFKYRFSQKDNDVVKFFVEGNINTDNAKVIENKINSINGISKFKIRDFESGECIAWIEKEISCDKFRTYLKNQYLDFNRNSIKILSKSYYTH